jgi:hypothetical protein
MQVVQDGVKKSMEFSPLEEKLVADIMKDAQTIVLDETGMMDMNDFMRV